MTFEDVLKIVGPVVVVLSPLFTLLFSVQSRLSRIEERLTLDKEKIEESLNKHDRHIHDIRNTLTGILLTLAKRGEKDER